MTSATDSTKVTRRRFLAGALVGGAVVGGASAVVGTRTSAAAAQSAGATSTASAAGSAVEEPTEADIGFCTDMTAHHVQALVMCERVLGFDTGHAVQAAATEVLRNQAIEVGMMRAWLADWGASTAPPDRVMAWMDMSADDMAAEIADHMAGDTAADSMAGMALADMPGYASDAELLSLSQAEDGIPKGRIWLELMRAHHVGGVAMATAAVELASADKVLRLAGTQAKVQAWEIEQYDLLLTTKYA